VTRGDVYALGASGFGERSIDAGLRGCSAFASQLCRMIAAAAAPDSEIHWAALHTTLGRRCRDGGGGIAGHVQTVQLECSRPITGRGRAFARLFGRKSSEKSKGREGGTSQARNRVLGRRGSGDGDVPPLVPAAGPSRQSMRRKRRVGGG
jgi:hypothetical protein